MLFAHPPQGEFVMRYGCPDHEGLLRSEWRLIREFHCKIRTLLDHKPAAAKSEMHIAFTVYTYFTLLINSTSLDTEYRQTTRDFPSGDQSKALM